MKKRAVIIVKCSIYTASIVTLGCLLYFDQDRIELFKLQYRLKRGTPEQKEDVLDFFMENPSVELVPSVIDAILDDTVSPRHGDTGWARVHHQAAAAMCRFAQTIDGKTQKERGRHEYSFFEDGGIGTRERRRQVHGNWSQWWNENKSLAKGR